MTVGYTGGGGDAAHTHVQGTPATVWTVTHGLAKRPSVTVTDSAGNVVYGDVKYLSNSSLTITFSAAFSGNAYLN